MDNGNDSGIKSVCYHYITITVSVITHCCLKDAEIQVHTNLIQKF
jgi:hypothetical protein